MPDHDPLPPRTLGEGGPAVGAVGLGCMGMSWGYGAADRDDDRSVGVIRRALELGVTLIDTADMYGPFHNEELVGRALDGHRDEAVLATKCGLVVEDAATYSMARDGRPEHVRAALEASLGRLRTDVIDLYQLHRVDEKVPIEETWGAMAELVEAGHVKAVGLSEVDVSQLERAASIHPVASVQSELSLWTRDPLDAVLPWCKRNGAAFIPFSPLGRGFLSGKLDVAAIGAEDFRSRMPRFQTEAAERNQAIVDRVREIAARHEATAAQVALAWVLAQGAHVIPIPGTKRAEYLEENAGAARLALGPDDMAHLDALPAAAGTRY